MARKPATKTALFHLGLTAAFAAMIAVLVNRRALDPALYTALLVAVMFAATVLTWWYEAHKERLLDELELARASFGARWGMGALSMFVLLLLFVTPLQDAIVWFAESYEDNDSRPLPAPVGVFVMGFVLAMVMHMIARSLLGALWMWTKS